MDFKSLKQCPAHTRCSTHICCMELIQSAQHSLFETFNVRGDLGYALLGSSTFQMLKGKDTALRDTETGRGKQVRLTRVPAHPEQHLQKGGEVRSSCLHSRNPGSLGHPCPPGQVGHCCLSLSTTLYSTIPPPTLGVQGCLGLWGVLLRSLLPLIGRAAGAHVGSWALEPSEPGFKFQLTIPTWVNTWTPWSLSLFIYKMGIMLLTPELF